MSKKQEEVQGGANLDMWTVFAETDPKYTKSFKRSGGFEGTAQNPTYAMMKMTKWFGPCGKGWGYEKPDFTLHNAGEEGVIVYSTVCLWYMAGSQRCEVYGVGGDMVVSKTKYGLKPDDEAFKKATTDALTNAMKTLGMAADLHLGMYDDNKYVNDLKVKYDTAKAEKSVDEIIADLNKALTVDTLKSTWKHHKADIAIHNKDAKVKKRLEEAGAKKKQELLAAIKAEAERMVKETQGRSKIDEMASGVDNYMKHAAPLDNGVMLDDSIPF